MYRNLFVICCTFLNINGQRWYTATLFDNSYSVQTGNFKPNFNEDGELKYNMPTDTEHQGQKETMWSHNQKPEITFYPIDERMVEGNFVYATTVPSTTNTLAVSSPSSSERNDSYPKYEKVPTAEPGATKNTTSTTKKQGYIRHDITITNINVIKRQRPKRRRIVKRCPATRPHRKNVRPNRKAKFLDVFQVVEFEHVPCVSSSGLEGICLHEYECKATGSGAAMGECADGFGVCCVTQFACGDQSAAQMGWFTNPGYPLPSTDRVSCSMILEKATPDIQQIRLDLMTFELLQPTAGACEQDQFVVSGQNINNFVPILCGVNNGQHMYLEVGDVPGPIYLSVQTVTADARLFAIKVSQLTIADELAVPTGCLQYYRGPQGILESFNYQDKSSIVLPKVPSYLNNLNYAMCIERAPETCSITYTNSGEMEIVNFDTDGLPLIPKGQAGVEIFNCPTDWLLVAAARLCGDRLNDGTVLQDFSEDAPVTETAAGPIVVWFKSDGVYAGRGFRLQYQQNSCVNPA